VPLRELRRKVSVVPQDSFVFSDSIRANVCLGRPEATEDELRAACEVAQFDADVADMPAGYDTLLGERGIHLSGGQKQRLAIARAVMLDPHILVLDDALSSVDTNTEERILQGLRRFLAGRTCVIIAHRCSTLRYAQQILYVEDGRIAERGTHEALLQADGHYAAMWRRQQLEAELEQDA